MNEKNFQPFSIFIDKGKIKEITKSCSTDVFQEIMSKKIISLNNILHTKVDIIQQNIYIRGTYLKFSREIGQSPWSHNGVKICASSVSEEISKTLLGVFDCENCVMSAGGREDRDVRMLGSGRPFIMEIVNPKKVAQNIEDIKSVEKAINENTKYIKVINLTVCDKEYYSVLKKYEDSKQKYYTCLVYASKNITDDDINFLNDQKEFEIIQKTPIRVMHRRVLKDRKKLIYKMDAKKVNENFLVIFRFFN
jgi:tRNA pseudouridine synthase 10